MILQKNIFPWVSCTPQQFIAIYQITWASFKTYNTFSTQDEETILEFICQVLKIRKGLLVPRLISIEQSAAESPQWTYAIFLSALLMKTSEMLNKPISGLRTANQDKMSIWQPYVPENVFAWLKTNERLITTLNAMDFSPTGFSVLSQNHHDNNDLLCVLRKTVISLQASTSLAPKKQPTFGDSSPFSQNHSKPLHQMLLDWMISTKAIDINQYTLIVQDGLLLTEPLLSAFRQYHQLAMVVAQLKKELQPFCVALKNNYEHLYRSNQVHDRRTFTGIVLARQYLNEDWQSKPIQPHFVLYR